MNDPWRRFHEWYELAQRKAGLEESSAMALATTDTEGWPSVRMVLLKSVDEKGLVFYTNLESAKGRNLAASPRAAVCFFWPPLRRQLRVQGETVQVTDAEADTYFQTRPRLSQLGAWASAQSETLESFFALEKKLMAASLRFGLGHIPRPSHWSGFRLIPGRMEFWSRGRGRLHERVLFESRDGKWSKRRLYP